MQKVFNGAALSNLRPETVVGLEGVSFLLRAKAMPGVVEVSTSISDVDSIHGEDADPIEPERLMRIKGAGHTEVMVVTDRHIVVGALAYDDDGSSCDPMDGDGQGKIHFRGRRGDSSSQALINEALGYDRYGDKDLKSDAVEAAMLENALKVLRKNRLAMTALSNRCRSFGYSGLWADVIDRVRGCIARAGWEYAMDEIAGELFNENYWSRVPSRAADAFSDLDFALRDTEAEKVWEDLVDKGLVGNPLAVMMDVYEHGGTSVNVTGEGMQCRWDTSRGGAIWIPDVHAVENITCNVLKAQGYGLIQWFGACGSTTDPLNAGYSLDGGATWQSGFPSWAAAMAELLKLVPEQALAEFNAALRAESVSYCKGMLDEYNSWANGDVHGVLVYVIDRHTGKVVDSMDDEVWGHIGQSYAQETLEDAVLARVLDLTKTLH